MQSARLHQKQFEQTEPVGAKPDSAAVAHAIAFGSKFLPTMLGSVIPRSHSVEASSSGASCLNLRGVKGKIEQIPNPRSVQVGEMLRMR